MGAARKISPAEGRLGVLMPGMGAVATTFMAGVELIKKGFGDPVGSLTQLGTIRLGKRTEERNPKIKEFVPLAELGDLVFGGWDAFPDDAYEAAVVAGVLEKEHLNTVRDELKRVRPWPAVFDERYVGRLEATHRKRYSSLREAAEQVREDIRRFKRENGLERVVMISCASTEAYLQVQDVHTTVEAFERGLDESSPAISPAMIYAYAAIMEGVPYANGSPSLAVDIPALVQLATERGVPIAGKDYKTGQTWMKTVVAPGIKARMLGMEGWFSTNILGNRDGEVLDAPENLKSKEVSKLSVLDYILQPDVYPELYGKLSHLVKINYYPPRGDAKEGWDNIDIFGWLGYPMQIKINFLARDSILAAPIVLDLALFLDLAQRASMGGIQEWLSFYFKSPMVPPELYPEHDLFIQLMKLKNTLRTIMGEEVIHHTGLDYYED
ncbi:inositol-3-phosphate synthase [Rubrobacter calidifluminis]|uniref:inositol-3-phosphate synthase n=1 Tax=Rubrobacter calidifluminis TaxID=1392640 RepID=UPI0023603417|nr:inositol-3-phosphate synthase [Rubrobacter calidifluminis]